MKGLHPSLAAGAGFGLENVPLGTALIDGHPTCVTRIGEAVIPLTELATRGHLPLGEFMVRNLEMLISLGSAALSDVRSAIIESAPQFDDRLCRRRAQTTRMLAPIRPRAFVDFYSGIHHASNVGRMFRPDQPPLLPNYRHLPVGYNGRGSSVFGSGTPIRRPSGQTRRGENPPQFGPTQELDFELEVGFVTCGRTSPGQMLSTSDAELSIAGLVLVNDWSARDMQRWEYQPLGPFLAKSFATSVSPWLVSLEALKAVQADGPVQDPPVLRHLAGGTHFDIGLEVTLQTASMTSAQTICRSNTRHLYWNFAQQLAHQSSNGTPIEPNDLYASGTISGPDEEQFGSMLELTWRGERPITLTETGETRTFLEDGDHVSFRAFAGSVSFGEVTGTVVP